MRPANARLCPTRAPSDENQRAERLNCSTLVSRTAAWDRRPMTPYSRRQLLVLLILLAVAGLGLAIGHWRRGHPDLADHLEQLDRAEVPPTAAPELGGRGPTPARASEEPAPRRARRRPPARDSGPEGRAP